MPLTASIYAGVAADLTGAPVAGIVPYAGIPAGPPIFLADGSGDFQASKIWISTRTLASATTEDLDIRGSLTDPFGATVAILTLKALIIRSAPENTTTLTLGNDTNHVPIFGAVAHTIGILPGGCFAFCAPKTGVTVTNATGDILQIANGSGATATYQITVIGT